MSNDAIDYKAFWHYVQYLVDGPAWYSPDGDWWLSALGIAAGGADFERARITLVGGPRDGEVVG